MSSIANIPKSTIALILYKNNIKLEEVANALENVGYKALILYKNNIKLTYGIWLVQQC